MHGLVARRLHLVGSFPAPDAESAMRTVLEHAAPRLASLPDGETGDRYNWAAGMVLRLLDHPALVVARAGDNADYEHQLRYRVRSGRRLRGEDLDFGQFDAYVASRPLFDGLRETFGRPDLSFLVGVPGDLDMALFTLGLPGILVHRRAFTRAIARTVQRIHMQADNQVLFQLEVPAELIAVAKMPAPLRRAAATWAANGIAEIARRAPRGTRFGLHLCLGDLAHRAMTQLRDTAPITTLANAVVRSWPGGRSLEFIHAPLASGQTPPPLEPAFYAPLARLRLPASTRFVAGLLHEGSTIDELRTVLAAVETAVGRPVDVAAACGLGRRSESAAVRTLEQGVALCAP